MPCPALRCMECATGNKRDANGCRTCECSEPSDPCEPNPCEREKPFCHPQPDLECVTAPCPKYECGECPAECPRLGCGLREGCSFVEVRLWGVRVYGCGVWGFRVRVFGWCAL